jgi:hypothetical protein
VLESYDALLQGGARGGIVLPGKSDLSRLLLVLDGRAKPAMPPEGNPAPKREELDVIKAWIDAGAKSPTGTAPDPTVLITPKVPLKAPARSPLLALAFAKDGKSLFAATYGAVRELTADTRLVLRELAGHRGPVTDVALSHDGTLLAARVNVGRGVVPPM